MIQNYQSIVQSPVVTPRLIARFDIVADGNITRIKIKSDTAAPTGGVDFSIEVNGSEEHTMTIDATLFEEDSTGLSIAVVDGDRVEIYTTDVPVGGIGEVLVITVQTDDGDTPMPKNVVNDFSAAHTCDAADANATVRHPAADNNARTFTIDSNTNLALPVGTLITFVNEINVLTIAITSDTLVLGGAGTTGSRSLAANGFATAVKVASTRWYISGVGLT